MFEGTPRHTLLLRMASYSVVPVHVTLVPLALVTVVKDPVTTMR